MSLSLVDPVCAEGELSKRRVTAHTAGESLNTPPIGAASKRRRATTAAVTTPDGYKGEFFMQRAGPVGPLGMFLVVPAISVRQNAVRGGGSFERGEPRMHRRAGSKLRELGSNFLLCGPRGRLGHIMIRSRSTLPRS